MSDFAYPLHEECGVFGIYDKAGTEDVSMAVYSALYALQHRGQESCGIVVNDETLSVEVIREVGPRSDFLSHMNTYENMHIQSKPKLIDRLTRDRWNEAGGLDMEARALAAAKELLATWKPEPLSDEARARVRAVVNAAERDYGVPESEK